MWVFLSYIVFLKIYCFYFIWISVCMYAICIIIIHRVQNRVLYFLEQESELVWAAKWVLGTIPTLYWSSDKAAVLLTEESVLQPLVIFFFCEYDYCYKDMLSKMIAHGNKCYKYNDEIVVQN